MNILIVEDSPEIREPLQDSLEAEGFAVDTAEDGEQGLYKALLNDYDLVLLDIGLPQRDGRRVCAEIRKNGKHMPIIILSVLSEIDTKASVLDIGADDYMVKPFSFAELLARVRACLRRPSYIMPQRIQVGEVSIDISSRLVQIGDRSIHLAPKEFSLLEYLVKNRGRVISRQEIIEHVWGAEGDLFSNTIETHVSNLRKKLGRKKDTFIATVSNGGYKIDL